jgi:hypothetical protein
MIGSQANLNWVPEWGSPDYFYGRSGHDAHFHQAASDRTRALYVDNSRRQPRRERVERSWFVRSWIRLLLVFPQLLFPSG